MARTVEGYTSSRFRNLLRFHLVCAIIQSGNALAQTVLCATTFTNTLPLYTTIPGFRGPEWTLTVEKIGDIRLGVLSAVFLWLSALQHFWTFLCRDTYAGFVRKHRNPARWLEYTFSASTMKFMIGLLSGVMVRGIFLPVIVLTMATMFCGYLSDPDPDDGRKRPSLKTFWFGTLFWLASWEPVMSHFISGAYRNGAPQWVYALVFGLVGLDTTFAALQLWWLLPRTPKTTKNYMRLETGYCVLSLTSKLFLAWLDYIGSTMI